MQLTFNTIGVCSRQITVDVVDGVVKFVHFDGGCEGNSQGISKLVAGMKAVDAISLLEGIDCGSRGTSCPDQLAKALRTCIQ